MILSLVWLLGVAMGSIGATLWLWWQLSTGRRTVRMNHEEEAMNSAEAMAFIASLREWKHKGKMLKMWELEDYISYFHETFRPGVVLTEEMIGILGIFAMAVKIDVDEVKTPNTH